MRSCWKCLTEPMPAGSKTNMPLAIAEPVSDGRNCHFLENILKKAKKNYCTKVIAAREDGSENM